MRSTTSVPVENSFESAALNALTLTPDQFESAPSQTWIDALDAAARHAAQELFPNPGRLQDLAARHYCCCMMRNNSAATFTALSPHEQAEFEQALRGRELTSAGDETLRTLSRASLAC